MAFRNAVSSMFGRSVRQWNVSKTSKCILFAYKNLDWNFSKWQPDHFAWRLIFNHIRNDNMNVWDNYKSSWVNNKQPIGIKINIPCCVETIRMICLLMTFISYHICDEAITIIRASFSSVWGTSNRLDFIDQLIFLKSVSFNLFSVVQFECVLKE